MFKKKKPEEVKLEIGLHPIETSILPQKEPKVRGGGLSFTSIVLILGAIAISGMLIYGLVFKEDKNQAPRETSEPTVVTLPTSEEVEGSSDLGGISTASPSPEASDPTDSGVNGVVIDSKETSSPATEPPYVPYKNFLLGVEMNYPSKWFVTERTNESLTTLNKSLVGGKTFNLNEVILGDTVKVADFTPADEAKTTISVSLVPGEKLKGLEKGILKENLPEGFKIVQSEKVSSKDLGGFSVQVLNYVAEDKLTFKYNVTQMVFARGKSYVVLTGYAGETGVVKDKIAVMEEIAKSFKISDGGQADGRNEAGR